MAPMLQQIDEMNTNEKVQMMDYLWLSLERASSAYEPPAWHGDELARREKLYSEGRLPVYDWAEVKARLQSRQNAL